MTEHAFLQVLALLAAIAGGGAAVKSYDRWHNGHGSKSGCRGCGEIVKAIEKGREAEDRGHREIVLAIREEARETREALRENAAAVTALRLDVASKLVEGKP